MEIGDWRLEIGDWRLETWAVSYFLLSTFYFLLSTLLLSTFNVLSPSPSPIHFIGWPEPPRRSMMISAMT
ncbi:MAG: hypothetical protein NZM11_11620, partial [Anaerolineales bacterium]|nr:hypothetical protein [Anaerolineales bacterium]